MKKLPASLLLLILLLPLPARAASVPAPIGTGGAVAAADPLAVEAGLEALRAGGNAVDAAVATALALAVVYPEAGNLGGGGFAVVRLGGALAALDFREVGPAKARHDMYLDAQGKPIKEASLVGPLAAGVPGSPARPPRPTQPSGGLPWRQVVEPARRLAAEGFRVSRYLHDLLDKKETRKLLGRFPESLRVWLPDGSPPAIGSVLRLPDLAATLGRYAEQGPQGITTGPVAAAVEKASQEHGGVLTAADLAAYKPEWRQPLTFDAFGWKLASMPLPSSGGVILGQTLGMLERLGWAGLPRCGPGPAHRRAGAFRRAFADRFLLGDPTTTQATEAQLLAPDWIARRAAQIDPRHATPSTRLKPWPDAGTAAAGGSETTHL